MKYIKEITIKNFQSHELTHLVFDAGVNTLTGASDSGKTAIIRAISWALFNDLTGDYYVRKGTNDSSVKIVFSDQFTILRGRKGNKNYYDITLPDGKTKHYEGIGSKVPPEIYEYTGIKKINLDDRNEIALNIASQLESPFLLSESPGYKSTALGKLAGVDIVDNAHAKLRRDIYGLQSKHKLYLDEKAKEEKLLEEFSDLEYAEKKLQTIKELRNHLLDAIQLLNHLKIFQTKKLQFDQEIDLYQNMITKYAMIDSLYQQYHEMKRCHERYVFLLQLHHKWRSLCEEEKRIQSILSNTKNIFLLESQYNELENRMDRLYRVKNLYHRYTFLRQETKTCLYIIKCYQVKDTEKNIQNLMVDMQHYTALSKIKEQLTNTTQRIINGNKYLLIFEDITKVQENILELQNMMVYYKKFCTLQEQNLKIYHQLCSTRSYHKDLQHHQKELLKKYESTIRTYSVCPFCYNIIDEEHIELLLKEYF